ncbi:MAG TPA: 30S ribosomal protein S6 [Candidatus Cloacimonadota bacterium]|nr:30S ribosomal protein S6 [Candidatus Cloacimonadota bacterium]HOV16624.1 30S ribosomal protein S6 [Candidatus Cloacimonadota bacterium]HQL15160.1 30S ribosomal protein S6 [Candidatus Cloacimonadota bacterium]
MLKNYESMIILKPQFSQEEAIKANDAAVSVIKDNGGELIKTDIWGKRQLAYPIQKQTEGYYFINYFKADSDQIKNIHRLYNINESILRYIIIDRDRK